MKVWVAVAHHFKGGVAKIACANTSEAARAKLTFDIEDDPHLDLDDLILDQPVEVEVVQHYRR